MIYKVLEDITEDNKSQIQEIVKRQFDHDPKKISSILLTDPPHKSNLNNELFECSNILKCYGFSEVDSHEVMMTRHIELKITNFQLAKKVSDVKVNDKGSILNIYNWAAPEMMQEISFYTQKCEIFSFGMLLWELAYQKIPYKEKSAKEIRDYVIKSGRESLTISTLMHPKIQEEIYKNY
ncbi:kinase-like protein [Gigaspora margarita]|uniref:Kinase-like protein n=1 Tax=Gigaspora margarita TaxID=4874 RepID=A0A8H4A4C1_GIGMA|nr:kinase-like protein [Gigaspora margarita]